MLLSSDNACRDSTTDWNTHGGVHYGGEQSEPTWRRIHCPWHIPRRGSDDVQLGRGGSKSSHSPILLESRPAWFWAEYRDVDSDGWIPRSKPLSPGDRRGSRGAFLRPAGNVHVPVGYS